MAMQKDPFWRLSRRQLLDLGGKGAAGWALSRGPGASLFGSMACSAADHRPRTVHGACYHDCPDTCSWTVIAEGGKITHFGADPTNPLTAGQLCRKMERFPDDVTFHPDRILQPLKRVGAKGEGTFVPVSWDEALRDIAGRLRAVLEQHGSQALLPYSFAGTEGLVQRNTISNRFFARLGASRLDRTICGHAAVAGVTAVYGRCTGILPEDVAHSRYLLFWGTNPMVSNQHLWPLVEQARSAGARVVVVDPFRSATAEVADWHIQPRPGTDVVLALSLIQVMVEEGLHDQEFIAEHTLGFERLATHVQRYAPSAAAEITGLDPEVIRQLAREYAKGGPSLVRMLIGMEHQANGANAFRAVSMLPAVTGAWKHRGGGFLHMTWELFGDTLNWERIEWASQLQNGDSRTINMVQIGRALEATDDPIKALFVYNANPAVIAPDQNAVLRGLTRDDLFTVVLEHFITDTARYADYVLPATTQLEHWDLMTSWGHAYINLNEPAIAPRGESLPNSEIFRRLAAAMALDAADFAETDLEIIQKTLQSDHPWMEGITFENLRQTGWARLRIPEGWTSFADGTYPTPSGKCELSADHLEATWGSAVPTYTPVERSAEDRERFPLQILTVKSIKGFLNSSHANVAWLRREEGEPRLEIRPEDAEPRGIRDGAAVEVFNDRGRMRLVARVSARIPPGVVCLPQGYWPSLLEGGSSANALTSDGLTEMGGGAALHDSFGEVRALA